jgi:hypothetical protein
MPHGLKLIERPCALKLLIQFPCQFFTRAALYGKIKSLSTLAGSGERIKWNQPAVVKILTA